MWCEQGAGDAIQFARYAPLLAERGARVWLECPAPPRDLFASLRGVERLLAPGESAAAGVGAADFQAPLLSVPGLVGTRLDSIPRGGPYRAAPRVRPWEARLGVRQGTRVGLAWAGNPRHPDDRRRSCGLAALAPLAGIPGVRFHGLQRGGAAGEAASPPGGMALTDWGQALGDFARTAALVACLDLVISVDTAVAHLAGAMGKRVWLALPYAPDWRWMLGREDTPWYPTMRLFRQPRPGAWGEVFARMAAEPRQGPSPLTGGRTLRKAQGHRVTAYIELCQFFSCNPVRPAVISSPPLLVASAGGEA